MGIINNVNNVGNSNSKLPFVHVAKPGNNGIKLLSRKEKA